MKAATNISFAPVLMLIPPGGEGKKAWLMWGLKDVDFVRVCCCELDVEVVV